MNGRIICRCEDVTLDRIDEFLQGGENPVSLHEVKLQTRAGMGICQGRTCMPLLTRIVENSGCALDDDAGLARNPPARPQLLSDLAQAASDVPPGEDERGRL